ncbi:hypothetical protein [Treponema sp.]|uniref:hypothetical protein n=1 Tax=Treponema sp. TaxID=166 RepID=UPI0025E2DEAF|nr:hypothetical protein [Treponema sp.]MCR5218604.1 hypothetical protein [Treponema sp.]
MTEEYKKTLEVLKYTCPTLYEGLKSITTIRELEAFMQCQKLAFENGLKCFVPDTKETGKQIKYLPAKVVAEATSKDYETLKSWCEVNGKKKNGKGFLLSKTDYIEWCNYIGAENAKELMPVRTIRD